MGEDEAVLTPGEDLRCDYVQTMVVWSNLVDVRFRLLAIVPALTGAGVGLLGQVDNLGTLRVTLVASLGLITVIALTLYDLRNSIFHDFTVHRLRTLERRLNLQRSARTLDEQKSPQIVAKTAGGVFAERPRFTTHLSGLRVQHDWALALAYTASAGAWAGLAAYSAAARFTTVTGRSATTHLWVSAGGILLVIATMTFGFWWHGVRKAFFLHTLTGGATTQAWPEWPTTTSKKRRDKRITKWVIAADAAAGIERGGSPTNRSTHTGG